jgi:hypothetical protein
MTTSNFHPQTRQRQARMPKAKLRPASQSYLLNGQAGALTVIFGIAALLLGAHLWLVRLLG